ncbi:MAG: hypothetical protein ACR2OG_01365 [Gemmatimonadaceae bacterium]
MSASCSLRSFVSPAGRLEAKTYEVKDGTLRVSGDAPTTLFPTAALSYAILPLNGQFLATQATAWHGWVGCKGKSVQNILGRMGLWGQLGLSLNDQAKQVFAGLATDLLRGVTVGVGRHFGYIDIPNAPVDSRVPASQTATRKM